MRLSAGNSKKHWQRRQGSKLLGGDMQRKKLLTIVIAGAMVLALASLAFSQPMSTGNSKPAENSAVKKEMPAVKSNEMTTKTNQEMMASKMANTMESSADDWARIETHYNEMMKMTDAAALKTEMAKHQEMMTAYRAKMMANSEANHKNMSAQGKTMAKGENTKVMGETKAKTTSH
jgi:hypothetical protein